MLYRPGVPAQRSSGLIRHVAISVVVYLLLLPVAYLLLVGTAATGLGDNGPGWGDAATLAFIGLAASWGAQIGARFRQRRDTSSHKR